MRHIVFPTILLVLLLTFCMLSAWSVSTTIDQVDAYLNAAVRAHEREDSGMAARYIKLASDRWEQKQVLFGIVLKHDEMDQVTTEFARLHSYASSQDRDDFLSNCRALQSTLSHIREMEWPYPQNIL